MQKVQRTEIFFCCPQTLQEHPWACHPFFVPSYYFDYIYYFYCLNTKTHSLLYLFSRFLRLKLNVRLQTCFVFAAKRLILANLVSHFSVNFEGFPRKPIQSINLDEELSWNGKRYSHAQPRNTSKKIFLPWKWLRLFVVSSKRFDTLVNGKYFL